MLDKDLHHPFHRKDESDDALFYSKERLVAHLDKKAQKTVEDIIATLVIEEKPRILDLMASWDSHLPTIIKPSAVVGLGMNQIELDRNTSLTGRILHDLNQDPVLPLDSGTFDVVLNVVSVDYLTRPHEVFEEVARILKPGGLFLVVFSNRYFPEKVIRHWKQASELERIGIVEGYFASCNGFERPEVFLSRGRSRPQDDPHALAGLPSDPIYAVYADRKGSPRRANSRPPIRLQTGPSFTPAEIASRKARVGETLRCPYCDTPLESWRIPDTPFSEWDVSDVYVCFNPDCPFTVRSLSVMQDQGVRGVGYRLLYNPVRDRLLTVPDTYFGYPRG